MDRDLLKLRISLIVLIMLSIGMLVLAGKIISLNCALTAAYLY
jgi:hypothetical protein